MPKYLFPFKNKKKKKLKIFPLFCTFLFLFGSYPPDKFIRKRPYLAFFEDRQKEQEKEKETLLGFGGDSGSGWAEDFLSSVPEERGWAMQTQQTKTSRRFFTPSMLSIPGCSISERF